MTILHQDLVHVRVVASEPAAILRNARDVGTLTVSIDHDLWPHFFKGKSTINCHFQELLWYVYQAGYCFVVSTCEGPSGSG